MEFISNLFKGIAIGAGCILPGISSGVLCVIFGIYEKLLNSVLGFFKDIKTNFQFLFPIILGIGIGVITLGNFLTYFIYQFPLQIKSLFIGLIAYSIPSLIKNVNSKNKFKISYLIFFVFSFLLGLLCVYVESHLSFNISENINVFYLAICGFCMSVGIIVPGVSSTIILMLLGIYSLYLTSISTLYFPILIPMGIGLIIGCLICMKLTKYLLEKYYSQTFFSIIGFTLGSILVILPNISSFIDFIVSVLCVILGAYIFRFIDVKEIGNN